MTTGWKLAIGGAVVVGVTAYMSYLGGTASWQYYLTVDECLAGASQYKGARVRVGGRVAASSLAVAADRAQVTFSLDGSDENGDKLPVIYLGPLPDNLAEQVDVIVEGQLEATGRLQADKVLTRCASKYEPREHLASGGRDLQSQLQAEVRR